MTTQVLLKQLYEIPESDIIAEINQLKAELGDQVLILGHHYQREEVFAFADVTGDSLKLAQKAAETDASNIIFCGVHFMAETADVLTSDAQTVILPDLAAGCSMADMADDEQVIRVWQELATVLNPDECVTPVTYINSTAALKAFCGEHGGIVCTSGNAQRIMEWAWGNREKILFFPDQHLGENTALAMGIAESEMIIWDPFLPLGGNTPAEIEAATLILWKGFCSVHQLFKAEHAVTMRSNHAGIEILAHPECSREVCDTADFVGSTERIIAYVEQAKPGQTFAIATELNLVNRLRILHPDKPIWFLSPMICMCSTMFRTDPQHLCAALRSIRDGHITNRIEVPHQQKRWAKLSLERMLNLG
ncbi:MAG: quinolinate synthase [Zetaproteobacteria bacterium CG12_big_fil_rev_8_21_14_0_65_54_13]|nr:MAG: quinolinate synthase [Zetaproteobacteria bacterium CG23_combo_of_CG06-09_8_20_14_all_54_7]PIW47736.1 MAG: quinolinate synthase [Zetaproteobacteria bacterium CG12_big_fil_rev_8_21_14_0_65_54_13]PIX55928.1 MAG: quinolinate synthase [Zetaproteobacteria bacterium CG_4_10_14_3_um_filter_54_28]PJA30404.1 MAG: quinolinate synthase [Zetaproteobacteria bacterium CG_4_9_14_3_um_filter_54_145]